MHKTIIIDSDFLVGVQGLEAQPKETGDWNVLFIALSL
jgi:hypothetical protein